jgi:bifunctional DNA-binding transcriptional regulator/antitoxin component of YhaV-PrlF toxin-antitoxin module
MVEEGLKVGKRGEIFTTRRIREALGLEPGTYVSARVIKDTLVIRGIPKIDELLKDF